MQGVVDKINNEIREKGSDKNPIPRVPPVTRAVIPVRDHLCPPLLLGVSTAAAILFSIKTLIMPYLMLVNEGGFTHSNKQNQLVQHFCPMRCTCRIF